MKLVFYPTLSHLHLEFELSKEKIQSILESLSKEFNAQIEYSDYQAYLSILSTRLVFEHIQTIDSSNQKLKISFKEKQSIHLRKPCSLQLEEICSIISKYIQHVLPDFQKCFYSILWTTSNIQEKSSLLFFHKLELGNFDYNIKSQYTTPRFIGLIQVKFNEKYWNYSGSVCKCLFKFNNNSIIDAQMNIPNHLNRDSKAIFSAIGEEELNNSFDYELFKRS